MIHSYLGDPADLKRLMAIVTPKPPKKFEPPKCKECSDTGMIEHMGGFDYDRRCSNGCPIS